MGMELENRLISADGFIEDIKTEIMNLYLDGKKGTPRPRKELYDIIDRINEQPTVDAVEVVRCKDCKYGMKSHLQPRHAKNYLCRHSWEGEYHEPNHFCSYGERRTDA